MNRQRTSVQNKYCDDENLPSTTMNGESVQVDINQNPQTERSADSPPNPVTTTGVPQQLSKETGNPNGRSNREYKYAHTDKLSKKPRVKRLGGYDKIVEFKPNIDKVGNFTGSDTLMHENDLYDSTNSDPPTTSVELSASAENRTSLTIMEENSELYDSPSGNVLTPEDDYNVNTYDNNITQKNTDILTDHTDVNEVHKSDTTTSCQDESKEKTPLCAVNSETIMTENTDIYENSGTNS